MAEAAGLEAAFIRALAPSTIIYPDYEMSENFQTWLSGLEARVRDAFRFSLDDKNELEEEMCQCIPARLSVGEALNAYHRLTSAEAGSYNLLVSRLTEEFTDKHEQRLFREKLGYNKRKKGQKLKEFAQEIKNDMSRYSGLSDKITINGAEIANPEKVREGIRRFRTSMRNKEGRKDKDLTRHLLFHLMEDADLTWENAIMVASRWEMASTASVETVEISASGHASSSSSSGDATPADESDAIGNVEEESASN